MPCTDKVALVTGAAGSGMGRSIALTLAREGAHVIVNFRSSEAQAQAVVQAIQKEFGGEAIALQADITSASDCVRLVEGAVARFGRVDICLIGPGAGWHPAPPSQLAPSDGLEDIRAEIAPVYNLMPLVLPGMFERGWGRIIGLSLLPPYNSPAYSYNTGKAARTQALMLAKDQAWAHGVTVNVVAPGPITAISTLEDAVAQCLGSASWLARATASPQDVAEAVAFLCSESGRFITGCELPLSFR